MSDLETRLREALEELVPAEPSVTGLAAGALRYSRRARARRLALVAAAVTAVVATGSLVLGPLSPEHRTLPAGPRTTPMSCPPPPSTPGGGSTTPTAAWVCPDPSAASTGDGWVLPVVPLTGRYAAEVPAPEESSESSCPSTPLGPAFILTLRGDDGAVSRVRSSDYPCAGSSLMSSYYSALADQEADVRAAASPERDLACRSVKRWEDTRKGTSLDSPLVAANVCFAPVFIHHTGDGAPQVRRPMTARSYRSAALPPDALAMLNRDLTRAQGSYRGNGECLVEGDWTYSVLGWTASGQSRMLYTGCLDELFVAGTDHVGLTPSADTTAALEALVPTI